MASSSEFVTSPRRRRFAEEPYTATAASQPAVGPSSLPVLRRSAAAGTGSLRVFGTPAPQNWARLRGRRRLRLGPSETLAVGCRGQTCVVIFRLQKNREERRDRGLAVGMCGFVHVDCKQIVRTKRRWGGGEIGRKVRWCSHER